MSDLKLIEFPKEAGESSQECIIGLLNELIVSIQSGELQGLDRVVIVGQVQEDGGSATVTATAGADDFTKLEAYGLLTLGIHYLIDI